MSPRILKRIRGCIDRDHYYFTDHAFVEMTKDGLLPEDVVSAIRSGKIKKIASDDPRGDRYTIIGSSRGISQPIGAVGRFTETGEYRIITAYLVSDEEE